MSLSVAITTGVAVGLGLTAVIIASLKGTSDDQGDQEDLQGYDESKAATVGLKETTLNHLLTSSGILYRSNDDQSVESVFVNEGDPKDVDVMWMKKAPNASGSELLINFFRHKYQKPVLHIGHIYRYTGLDRQGLKNLIKEGFELKVWEHVSDIVRPKYSNYTNCLRMYLELLQQEVLSYPEGEPMDYKEQQVAVISCGEHSITHLLTNEGRMYRNRYEPYEHAEVVFTSAEGVGPQNVSEMWIKNSPCSKCTKVFSQVLCGQPKTGIVRRECVQTRGRGGSDRATVAAETRVQARGMGDHECLVIRRRK